MNRRQLLIGGGAVASPGAGAPYLAATAMGQTSDYSEGNAALRQPLADTALGSRARMRTSRHDLHAGAQASTVRFRIFCTRRDGGRQFR